MKSPIIQPYGPRPVRFLGLIENSGWRLKTYSISVRGEQVDEGVVAHVCARLPEWVTNSTLYDLPTYGVGILILHEGREGCFAIVGWWIDENMFQEFVYLATDAERRDFRLFSDRGVFTCVWELSVLWFERNAWVEYVLKAPGDPQALDRYLAQHFNADV
jgi:hypothetical protein